MDNYYDGYRDGCDFESRRGISQERVSELLNFIFRKTSDCHMCGMATTCRDDIIQELRLMFPEHLITYNPTKDPPLKMERIS